tara:strand:- start:326 stop:445 length:120 start_codon:yes stop_codon:yes gene_type:complete
MNYYTLKKEVKEVKSMPQNINFFFSGPEKKILFFHIKNK